MLQGLDFRVRTLYTLIMKEFYDSGSNKYYTLIDEELYVLNEQDDEWEMLDFEDMDLPKMIEYGKIIGELTH